MSIRVAVLSPISWRTPPRHYGPWESVVNLLSEGLVQRGLDVTLFATGDSQTSREASRRVSALLLGGPVSQSKGSGVFTHLRAIWVKPCGIHGVRNTRHRLYC